MLVELQPSAGGCLFISVHLFQLIARDADVGGEGKRGGLSHREMTLLPACVNVLASRELTHRSTQKMEVSDRGMSA